MSTRSSISVARARAADRQCARPGPGRGGDAGARARAGRSGVAAPGGAGGGAAFCRGREDRIGRRHCGRARGDCRATRRGCRGLSPGCSTMRCALPRRRAGGWARAAACRGRRQTGRDHRVRQWSRHRPTRSRAVDQGAAGGRRQTASASACRSRASSSRRTAGRSSAEREGQGTTGARSACRGVGDGRIADDYDLADAGRIGAAIGAALRPGDVVALYGVSARARRRWRARC